MKKLFEEDENGMRNTEKARIIMTIIPFVLIIIILAISLIVNSFKRNRDEQDIQTVSGEKGTENGTENEAENEAENKIVPSTPLPYPTREPVEEEKEILMLPSPTPYKEIMEADRVDYSRVEFNVEDQLKELMYYFADGNQAAMDDLTNLERFRAMSWKLSGTKEFYYFGDTDANGLPDGVGIAVYADNQYYYGEWKDGVRSGMGTWIHYHVRLTQAGSGTKAGTGDIYTYHQYQGSWEGDLPQGEGAEHYEYDISLLQPNVGYNTNLIGNYAKGLVNGEFYITNIYSDGNMKEWYAQAEKGSWIYQNDSKDKVGRRPVQVEDRDPNNYIWMYPKDNINIGVRCIISKVLP